MLEPVAGKRVAMLPWVIRPASYAGKSWIVGGSGCHAIAMPQHLVVISSPDAVASPRVVVHSIRTVLAEVKAEIGTSDGGSVQATGPARVYRLT